MIVDLDHYIGSDLSISPTGDLALTPNATLLGQQRIVRRLITNPADYIWHLDYGGGVGRMIGTPANALAIKGVIRGQMSKEAAVSQTPSPTITVNSTNAGVVTALIQYADADTGETQVLTVPVG